VATSSAAVTGALRPTTVARNSSVRPSSSSARVCLPTRNIPMSPMVAKPKAPSWNTIWPPSVSIA